MDQIAVEGLTKTFHVAERTTGLWGAVRGVVRQRHREVKALDDIGFSLQAGELVGYIGPNGVGKSTTVKILAGILVPTSGRCEVMGRVPWKERVAHVSRIGVVFGQRTQLWWDLPVSVAAARAVDPVPRRAIDRPRCGLEARRARLHPAA